MRKLKFTSEQIAYCLTQAEAGVPIGEVCRKYVVSQRTFYCWKSKFGAMAPAEVRRLKFMSDYWRATSLGDAN